MVAIVISKRSKRVSLGFYALIAFISPVIIGCDRVDMDIENITTYSTSIKLIAHRGYWNIDGCSQNSIAAFINAGELGIYGSEFDVWKTRDDKLVVFHDPTYHGMTIVNTNFDDLRNPSHTLSNGEVIPSLDDLLAASLNYPNLHLILELKSTGTKEYNQRAVELVQDSVDKFNVNNRIVFISFNLDACRLFREINADAPIAFLGENTVLDELNKMGINGIDYYFTSFIANPSLVYQAHALGMFVNTWTVDDTSSALQLERIGVDMITTNNPKNFKSLFSI